MRVLATKFTGLIRVKPDNGASRRARTQRKRELHSAITARVFLKPPCGTGTVPASPASLHVNNVDAETQRQSRTSEAGRLTSARGMKSDFANNEVKVVDSNVERLHRLTIVDCTGWRTTARGLANCTRGWNPQ